MAATCELETLVSSSVCEVQYCADCGLFHVSMGPVSLRLSEAHFYAFSRDLNHVRHKLSRAAKQAQQTDKVRHLHS